MQTSTATIETTVDVPVGPGVELYDVPCEVEIEQAGDDWRIVTLSLDAFGDTSRPGRRWSYVEIARWHPGHQNPFTPTKLSWHLAQAIAKKLNGDANFDTKARTALCMAYDGERAQHATDKWKAARDDRAAAE